MTTANERNGDDSGSPRKQTKASRNSKASSGRRPGSPKNGTMPAPSTSDNSESPSSETTDSRCRDNSLNRPGIVKASSGDSKWQRSKTRSLNQPRSKSKASSRVALKGNPLPSFVAELVARARSGDDAEDPEMRATLRRRLYGEDRPRPGLSA